MPSNQTPNYGLSKWAKSDRVLMDDFNADNAKIDEALAGKADASVVEALAAGAVKWEASHYIGSGTASRLIKLPFKPKFMLIQDGTDLDQEDTHMIYSYLNGVLYQSDHTPHILGRTSGFTADAVDGGMQITATGASSETELARIALNRRQSLYLYLAIG